MEKLDTNFKGRPKKVNTEMKQIHEPVQDVKKENNMQNMDIIFENLVDSGSESSEEEEFKKHRLVMTKTRTEAPKIVNSKTANLKGFRKSFTIR